ncbi:MAG: hypothetical protein ABIL09_08075, partial [Gemmatimonadota bacterium]
LIPGPPVSFSPPNHTRASFLALFFTWLYLGSVLWYHGATRQSVDLLSLAEGSVSVGVLVYGIAAVHRLFWVNLLPFTYHVGGTLWSLPTVLTLVIHGLALAILLGSLAIVAWAWYHAHRARLSFWRGLPTAFLLATPLLVYEVMRQVAGIDIFERLVAAALRLSY